MLTQTGKYREQAVRCDWQHVVLLIAIKMSPLHAPPPRILDDLRTCAVAWLHSQYPEADGSDGISKGG